ncbi:redoxin [Alkalilimnicola ehrlichii]|uniref:Redoxin n=1 Tax=Alkalilimnicola ehrlichii TaxID=351052 RepID=A0A3E0X0T6_9GAMM|nr:TlpA disulfide reductase family protein [Alkalilimnicola ehrlichii]RFA31469.1 redoxin [Alkalilimnicola ehrlichii]RFA39259.1 redoxin [Alkalilimnicola ehrlichii]
MKRKEILGVLALVLVVATAALVWVGPWQGERAANVSFETLDGRTFDLHELRGKPVLITFWATTCPSCIAEVPHLRALYQDLGPEGLEVIGVAMHYDPPNQVAAMVEDRNMSYTIVMDRDDAIAQSFGGIRLTPTSILINPEGRVVWRRLGELNMEQVRNQIQSML